MTRAKNVLALRRQKSQSFFERHARDWDRLAEELLPTPAYLPALMQQLSGGELLVEVGVGTGSLLEDLSGIADRVVGVDHSPAMLQAARERCAHRSLHNVELRLGEMEHLPLEDAGADLLLLHMVLHHAAAPEVVLGEAGRVLRPGGRLVIIDLLRHQHEWVRDKLADQWLGFECDELEQWCRLVGFDSLRCEIIAGDSRTNGIVRVEAINRAYKDSNIQDKEPR